MHHAAITGWGMSVPDKILTNADLETHGRDERRMDRLAHRDP